MSRTRFLYVLFFISLLYNIHGFYSKRWYQRFGDRTLLFNSKKESIKSNAMGAGAPMLGEYKETDENGKMLFELEANNFADKDGNSLQSNAPYFDQGYEGNRFEEDPPNFWTNLLSGGRLQSEWEKGAKDQKQNKTM